MSETRQINGNDVYVLSKDPDSSTNILTLYCFKPDGSSYVLDKINVDDGIKSTLDTSNPVIETEGTVDTNASFTVHTYLLKKSEPITTADGKVSGIDAEDKEVQFKLGHIVSIENDPNSNTIAYGVVLVEEQ